MRHGKKILVLLLAAVLAMGLAPMPETAAAPESEEEIRIADQEFRKLINTTLSREEDTPVTKGDMESLTYLRIDSGSGVTDIDGIQYAVNLSRLYIDGDVQSLEQISGLGKLEILSVTGNSYAKELSWLGSKPVLGKLSLYSCEELVSLDGIEKAPALKELDCSHCGALSDISALRGQTLSELAAADFGDSPSITDISPLEGYTSLMDLDLEKVDITSENRDSYRAAVRSLTNLKVLYMPYCGITDEDTEMFSGMQDLDTLVLNMNELTSTAFCNALPADIQKLSLHGNEITDMTNLARLKDLTILGLGNNHVTDFSFISELTSLTDGSLRHAEGEEDFPFVETYYFGSSSDRIQMENGRFVIENPYIGKDGKRISFTGAEAHTDGKETVTMEYDEATGQITVSDMPAGTSRDMVTIEVRYDLPVSGGEVKVGRLRICAYVQEKEVYQIRYDWGTEAPDGQILPSDTTRYQSLEEAKAAVDKTFTGQTAVKGEKDGKQGTWTFSGWEVTVEGNVVNAKGLWSFTEDHQHEWGQPVYTWSEDGKSCTAERVCAGDSSHVEKAEAQVTSQVTVPATCTAKGKTAYTADFAVQWAETQTKVLEDIDQIPHSYGSAWKSDEADHWKECEACGARKDEAAHTWVWVVDREATKTEEGSQHQECTVCGYEKAAVKIPAAGTSEKPGGSSGTSPETGQKPGSTATPQTGDGGNFWLPIVLMLVSGGAVLILAVQEKRHRA